MTKPASKMGETTTNKGNTSQKQSHRTNVTSCSTSSTKTTAGNASKVQENPKNKKNQQGKDANGWQVVGKKGKSFALKIGQATDSNPEMGKVNVKSKSKFNKFSNSTLQMKIRPGQIAMPDFKKDEIREIIYGVEEAHNNLIDVGNKAAILKIKLNYDIVKTPALKKYETVKSLLHIFRLIDPTCRLVRIDENGYIFGSEMKLSDIQEDNWTDYVRERKSSSFKIELEVKARVPNFGKYLYTWLAKSSKYKCKTEIISYGETTDVCWLRYADTETHNMETMKDFVANILGDIPFHLHKREQYHTKLNQDPIVTTAIFVEVKNEEYLEAKRKLCESGRVFTGLYRNIVPVPAIMEEGESAESPFWMHYYYMKKRGLTVIDYKVEDENLVIELLKRMLNERIDEKKYICTAVDIYGVEGDEAKGVATLSGPGEFRTRLRNMIPQFAMSLGIEVTVRKGNKDFIDIEGQFYENEENSIREYNILKKTKKKKSKESETLETTSETEMGETAEEEPTTKQTEVEQNEVVQEELEQENLKDDNSSDLTDNEESISANNSEILNEIINEIENEGNEGDDVNENTEEEDQQTSIEMTQEEQTEVREDQEEHHQSDETNENNFQDEEQDKETQLSTNEGEENQETGEEVNKTSGNENVEKQNQDTKDDKADENQKTINMSEVKALIQGSNNKINKRIDNVEDKLDDHIKETDAKNVAIQKELDEFRKINSMIQDETKIINEKSKELEQEMALNNISLNDKIQQIQMETSEATNQIKLDVHKNFKLQMRHQREFREASQEMKQEILSETEHNIKKAAEESKAFIGDQTENIKTFMTNLMSFKTNLKSDDYSAPIPEAVFTKKDKPGQVTPQKQRKTRGDSSTSSTAKSLTLSSTSTNASAKRKRVATRSVTQKRKKMEGQKDIISLMNENDEDTESEDESLQADIDREAAKVTPKRKGRKKATQNSSQTKTKVTRKTRQQTRKEIEESDSESSAGELFEKPLKIDTKKRGRGRPRNSQEPYSQTKPKTNENSKEEAQKESMEASERIRKHKDFFKNLKKKKLEEAKQRRKNEVTQTSDSDSYDGYEDIDERIAIKKQKKSKYPNNGKQLEEEPEEEYTTDNNIVWDEEHTKAQQTTLTKRGLKFRSLTNTKRDTNNNYDEYTEVQE